MTDDDVTELMVDAAKQLAIDAVSIGQLTFRAVAEHPTIDRVPSQVNKRFSSVTELRRAVAQRLVDDADGTGNWPGIVAAVRGQQSILGGEPFTPTELAVAEAYCWLARHGVAPSD